jgi:hypothetical protein
LAAIAQRDRFLKRVVEIRRAFAVAGSDGLARVPSRRQKGREVTLFWSRREEAERWAEAVASNPRVKELMLSDLLMDVLPALATIKRFAGVDWNADGVEPEFDAGDLAERIRLEALEAFVHRAMVNRRVFTLEGLDGPALLVSRARPDQYFMPCWAERAEAEMRIEGPWRDMMAMEIPLSDFLERKLPWLSGRGILVAPGHSEGAGTLELEAMDLKARFTEPAQAG